MPSLSTICKWQAEPDGLVAERLAHARETGATTLLDEIVEISDAPGADAYVAYDSNGKPYAKLDGDTVQRAKLRVYARETYARMIAPRIYGQRMDVTSGGKPLPAPTTVIVNRVEALLVLAQQRKALGPMLDVTPLDDDDEMRSLMS